MAGASGRLTLCNRAVHRALTGIRSLNGQRRHLTVMQLHFISGTVSDAITKNERQKQMPPHAPIQQVLLLCVGGVGLQNQPFDKMCPACVILGALETTKSGAQWSILIR